MKPIITPTRPRPIRAASRPTAPVPFRVADGEAPVAPVGDGVVVRVSRWPKLGRGTSPSTSHPLTVGVGHAGAGILVAE